jgi:signal transduction histidine kinase
VGIENTLLILQHRIKTIGLKTAELHKISHSPIELITEYGDLPLVTCYPGQLNQVFLNIINNAIDAVENQPYPRFIKISTSLAKWENPDNSHSPLPTPSIVIRISDNGCGISEDVLPKIFDPFFTTKPVGRGTGLGLSMSYQIVVNRHQGQLKCNSIVGQGTEFIVEIPIEQRKIS